MTIRIISLLMSACVVVLYIFSALVPSDPYFMLLVSSNYAVVLARLFLAALMIKLALQKNFKYTFSRPSVLVLSLALLTFGTIGIAFPSVDYGLFNYLKPLDYIFAIDAGTFFAITGLAYDKGRVSLPALISLHMQALRSRLQLRPHNY